MDFVRAVAIFDGLTVEWRDTRQEYGEFRHDLGEVRSELGQTKTSLIRWMFSFWIGTLAPLAGLVVYLTGR